MTGSFLFMRGYSCVCILVQNQTNLRASSRQVWDKFRTGFVFKLVRELSKNQTCPRVVRFYIRICGFCTGQVKVVLKTNLSASCPELSIVGKLLVDKFLAKLVRKALLVAAHHAGMCHTKIISLIGCHITKLCVAISPNCLPYRTPPPQR